MNSKDGPLIIVEDDIDDQEIIKEVLQSLGVSNTLLLFSDGFEALTYLQTTSDQPFLILCDINLPKLNGLELREEINADHRLRRKSVPFVFYSTNASRDAVKKAYDLTVQGFFIKNHTLEQLRDTLSLIVSYWSECKHPNN
ncbi:MAG TPA: response regulator [Flavitalea sp.]|nr:response regulator [Flavitalea sp.]